MPNAGMILALFIMGLGLYLMVMFKPPRFPR